MTSVKQILQMTPEQRRAAYTAKGIEKVTIDGVEFTDYGAFSFLNEKSYVKSPVRSADGSIGNLNSYATFVTPHLKMDFSLMSIESYRKLMDLIYSKNEFTVTCYDVVSNQTVTHRMYFATEEMPKLWALGHALNGDEWVELYGVQDYTVELIGTNASLDEINILYYDHNGKLISEATQYAVRGEDVVIGYDYIPSTSQNVRFDGEWERVIGIAPDLTSLGMTYRNGDVVKANVYSDTIKEIKFKAKVTQTDEYDLSINYGVGLPLLNSVGNSNVNSVKIKTNETLAYAFSKSGIILTDGKLLSFPNGGTGVNGVIYEDVAYDAYQFIGWYWTPEANKSTKVDGNTVFRKGMNSTIYQIYAPVTNTVTYHTGSNYISLSPVTLKYGEKVPLPVLASDGWTFKGWSYDLIGKRPIDTALTMPPTSITIYGNWVKNS